MPMASAYPAPSSVTTTVTAQMAQMKLPAPNPNAALCPFNATTQCVCRPCGAAMETRTVPTGLMSGHRPVQERSQAKNQHLAPATNFSVLMASASTAAGGVMEEKTVGMDQTRLIAVSCLLKCFFSLFFHPFSISCSANLFPSNKSSDSFILFIEMPA